LIEVKNLTKKYGNHAAVKGISFKIENGRIYGLLGPNGAGKSTTMNMITGCLAATSGSVLIDGHDIFEEPLEAKRHIGYLPELPPVYPEMTPQEYLIFVAEAKKVPFEKSIRQIKEVMELTGITEVKDRLIKNLSKGYRQRVGIAQAMIGDPDTIILDEPTVGLDPKQIIEIRNLIKSLGQIKTVIISSHILAEISAVCDHVLIISNGIIVADDTIENLEGRGGGALTLCAKCSEETAKKILSTLFSRDSFSCSQAYEKTTAELNVTDSDEVREAIFAAFAQKGVPILDIHRNQTTLESIFLSLTSDNYVEEEEIQEKKSFFSRFKKQKESDDYLLEDNEYKPLFSGKKDDGEEDNK
jgi:ABC-2 type transport system ATP-binding protein